MEVSGASLVFRLPKAGNSEADYEDAFAIGADSVAVADGATESSFARAWAEALVLGFTSEPISDDAPRSDEATFSPSESVPDTVDDIVGDLRNRIAPLQQAWHEKIAWDRLPWFAEDKARSGAFAALLSFRFLDMPALRQPAEDRRTLHGGRWTALAVGDTCMFQIRDDELRVAFPLELAEQFNSRPVLLSSNPANNERVWEAVAHREGDFLPGDIFLFATDALSHWILAETEAGRQPWQTLCALRSHAEFVTLVDRLRRDHEMRNDDVTLVRLAAPEEVSLQPDGGLGPDEAAGEPDCALAVEAAQLEPGGVLAIEPEGVQ